MFAMFAVVVSFQDRQRDLRTMRIKYIDRYRNLNSIQLY